MIEFRDPSGFVAINTSPGGGSKEQIFIIQDDIDILCTGSQDTWYEDEGYSICKGDDLYTLWSNTVIPAGKEPDTHKESKRGISLFLA